MTTHTKVQINKNADVTTTGGAAETVKVLTQTVEETLERVTQELKEEVALEKEPEVPAIKYQHYKCSRTAMRLITKKGKKVIFTGFEFLTADKDIIAYLDDEIEQGMNIIVKGELLTAEQTDPMAALKRKWLAEHLASEQKEKGDAANGLFKNLGDHNLNKLMPGSSRETAS